MSRLRIHFLGAAGTVTGSKFLLEAEGQRLLIDCGLFQGLKSLRELNWQYLPVDASTIDAVLLTHGHLDHSGFLPRLVRMGFKGRVYATRPTLRITELILRDSAKLQAEDAEKANAEGYTRHHPAEPLYTMQDVEQTLRHFSAVGTGHGIQLGGRITARFRNSGHIIGSTFIELTIAGRTVVFSGDIGRHDDLLMHPPERPGHADLLFIESTYGDRLHPETDVKEALRSAITRTIALGGSVIIPSFAVERTQTLMHLIYQLHQEGKLPHVPLVLDSPMGARVLEVFRDHMEWHRLPWAECEGMCSRFDVVADYTESLGHVRDMRPKVVIAGSGMVTGGRVLSYLERHLPLPESLVLLAGFQAEGTRGRHLQEGAQEIRFFGRYHPVRCRVEQLEGLSAHADREELLGWMSALDAAPRQVFVVHGEPAAADAMRCAIRERLVYAAKVPLLHAIEEFDL